jgi:hypothetical protein
MLEDTVAAHTITGADLNGDGAYDIAGTDAVAGSVFISLNLGAGLFEKAITFRIGASPIELSLLDLDGDADRDLVVLNETPGASFAICPTCDGSPGRALSVLRNDGDGTFSEPLHFAGLDGARSLRSVDLHGNAVLDLTVVSRSRSLTLVRNFTSAPASADRDRDGLPDECEPAFQRGDANGDGALDLSDAIHVLAHLFLSGPEPGCLEAADADDDGAVGLTDAVRLLSHLFRSGPPPSPPGSPESPCGPDPGLPGGPGDLGCRSHPVCAR